MIDYVSDFINAESLTRWFDFALFFAVGLVAARILTWLLRRAFGRHIAQSHALLLQRLVFYGLVFFVFAGALEVAGFKITTLLGAAGILSVAVGFASQTSASNVISGLFLMGERPFEVGNWIQVDGIDGEVVSVDLLSVKIRTFDNQFVRIPNETMIKSNITNFHRYPLRRLKVFVDVAYGTDLERVREIVKGIADRNPNCLDEPAPVFWFYEFGDSGLRLRINVWCPREEYFVFRTDFLMEIKAAFEREGIEIPFPQRTVHLRQEVAATSDRRA